MGDDLLANKLAGAPQIENVEILSLIGKGGMSLVFKAKQKQLDRIVAVKTLPRTAVTGEEKIKRFHREAKLTSALNHPNIVRTLSFGLSSDGQPYLILEFLDGLSLAEELKRNGRLSLQKFKDIFLPALSALGHAHQVGLIHRDLKPQNIMICAGADEATVKVVDFGIATLLFEDAQQSEKLTRSDVVLGTPSYMSPEQCMGGVCDQRSDLYSLACVMYESLVGEPPFTGNSPLELMHKQASEQIQSIPKSGEKLGINQDLSAAILWGLAKNPADRPQSAGEFSARLQHALERCRLDKVPELKSAGPVSAISKRVIWAAVLAAFFAGASCFCVALLNNSKDARAVEQALLKQGKHEVDPRTVAALERTKSGSLFLVQQLERMADRNRDGGNLSDAVRQFEQSLEIKKRLLGPEHPSIAETLYELAICCKRKGNYEAEEKWLKLALSIQEKSPGINSIDAVKTLEQQTQCYQMLGNYDRAEVFGKQTVAAGQVVFGKENPRYADCLRHLALCYQLKKNYADAEDLFKRAIKIREEATGAVFIENITNHWDVLKWTGETSAFASKQDADNRKARSKSSRDESEKNLLSLASNIQELADCYIAQGKWAQAEPLCERALAFRAKYLEQDNRDLFGTMSQLMRCYSRLGKPVQARALLKKLLLAQQQH